MVDKTMMTKFSNEEGNTIFNTLSKHYTIIAPVEKSGRGRFSDTNRVTYEQVYSFNEIEFFKKTVLSAKSVLLPIRQTMFTFRQDKIEETDDRIRPTIIFLRSCDIHAIKVMVAHFLNGAGYSDCYYSRIRQKVKIFLIECAKPFPNCFCVSLGTNSTEDYAVFMRKVEDGFEIRVRDEELKLYFPLNHDNVSEPRFVQQDRCTVKIPGAIDTSIFENDIWKEYSLRCIGCGRCTISCPTCTCFTVQDIIAEDKTGGERKRIWSSCMVKKFSLLAGNHDFRIKEGDRLRYRVLHKIYDFKKRQGINMCTGCGRCDDVCPEYISMLKCIEKINRITESPVING